MIFSGLIFGLTALVAILSGIGILVSRQAIYSALSLVANMVALAVLYLMLSAQFVAVVQVIVYAGAVMVLFLFVVTLISPQPDPARTGPQLQRPLAVVFATALVVDLALLISQAGWASVPGSGGAMAADPSQFGSVEQVGTALFTGFLMPFEVTSLLLVVAAVGAIYLSRRTHQS